MPSISAVHASAYGLSRLTDNPARLCSGQTVSIISFAGQNSTKKTRKKGRAQKDVSSASKKTVSDEYNSVLGAENTQESNTSSSSSSTSTDLDVMTASRSDVLQACTVTSFLISALGVVIRQVSHIASTEGLPVGDCLEMLTYTFEMWHVGLVTGTVLLVSSLRYLLLMTWPDFAESSDAANRQVLTSLEPLDYIVVAFLPGFSEELLFRGALLPLLGLDMTSVFLVAALFGILHLGSGRKYSFAIWATFVGILYGYAGILSSSIFVPMASHAFNNLVGGIIWRSRSSSSR